MLVTSQAASRVAVSPLVSPPASASPHAITLPAFVRAAKAEWLAWSGLGSGSGLGLGLGSGLRLGLNLALGLGVGVGVKVRRPSGSP